MSINKAYFLVLLLIPATCMAATAPVRVVLARVADHRVYVSPGVVQPMFPGASSGLRVTLQMQGQPAAVATSLGVVRVSAEDNLGGALQEVFASVGAEPIDPSDHEMHRIHFDSAGRTLKPKWFDVTLRFSEPPRAATAIVNLKGSFRVMAGGKLANVMFDPLKIRGKEVKSSILKQADLKIWVLKSAIHGAYIPGPANRFLMLYTTGHKLALKKVKVANALGQSLLQGWVYYSSSRGTQIAGYKLTRPLVRSDRVTLVISLGQKAITVPFDFAKIALP